MVRMAVESTDEGAVVSTEFMDLDFFLARAEGRA